MEYHSESYNGWPPPPSFCPAHPIKKQYHLREFLLVSEAESHFISLNPVYNDRYKAVDLNESFSFLIYKICRPDSFPFHVYTLPAAETISAGN